MNLPNQPSTQNLNRREYIDKVLGCWTGKNIGGTLGAPLEGKRELFDIDFYIQDLGGTPAPNDDLDLQLVWLQAVEERGIYNLNERILGECWMGHIVAPWNEYGVGKVNIANGLYPPLSGACNNRQWENSNGAWIRSEIWACLFPGSPAEAVKFAWMDSCVDHSGDGIYAELFTTALESAAFVESDIRKLIEIALAHIPADCRVARSVKLACAEFDAGRSFADARNAIVEENRELGWFQAPGNIGFTILGLLYGRGDFGKTICAAVNCGDDTDCTGATAGALLGIINGRSGIPARWIEPIGETIQTVAINRFSLDVPETLDQLTHRVVLAALDTRAANPTLPAITDAPTAIDDEFRAALSTPRNIELVWGRSSFERRYDLPWCEFAVEYVGGPAVKPGDTLKLKLTARKLSCEDKSLHFRWHLPEGWSAKPGVEGAIFTQYRMQMTVEWEIVPGEFSGAYEYPLLELRLAGRFNPEFITVPIQLAEAVKNDYRVCDQSRWDSRDRLLARRALSELERE